MHEKSSGIERRALVGWSRLPLWVIYRQTPRLHLLDLFTLLGRIMYSWAANLNRFSSYRTACHEIEHKKIAFVVDLRYARFAIVYAPRSINVVHFSLLRRASKDRRFIFSSFSRYVREMSKSFSLREREPACGSMKSFDQTSRLSRNKSRWRDDKSRCPINRK